MLEVNTDNIHDWSIHSLEKFRDTLSSNIVLKLGKIESQRLMLKLIKLEIDRQKLIKCINSDADLEKAKIIQEAKQKGVDVDI